MGEKSLVTNRRARREYFIEESLEAGLALTGSEIKSVRAGRANLQDSYVTIRDGEAWMLNCHIAPYKQASQDKHEPKRDRKLLLHRREINRLAGRVQAKGYTIIPLRLYLKNNLAKVEIGLARGKKLYDKRADLAKRQAERDIERALRRRATDE
ncbi:MAG TPA: SsrA-binding protein SmpB [Anaerolineae bacterium]|nr:SsrA-binding protein SmpB [Anaerolineae bacterium]